MNKNRILSFLLTFAIVLGILPAGVVAAATTSYAGGTGTEDDPYLIATADQLKYMRDLINDSTTNASYKDKYYELTADINLEGAEWEPIGYDAAYLFNGKFDGKGHVVKNINITQAYGGFLGFFGHVGNANVEISNLGIENLTIDCDDDTFAASTRIAGMVGRGGGTYKNCYVKDFDVKKSSSDIQCKVALFMSELRKATTFENCYVYKCEVTGTGIGELAGFARYSESAEVAAFTNCYVSNITTDCSKVYPFSYTYTSKTYEVTHTPVNCWSSLAPSGANATYLTCSDTDEASLEQIKSALVTADGVFAVNDNINDGYPYIVPPPEPTATPPPTPTPTPSPTPTATPTATPDTSYFRYDMPVITPNGNGTSTVSLNVAYGDLSDKYDSITFTVVVMNAKEDIISSNEEEYSVSAGEFTDTFSVTVDSPQEGEEIVYYLWGNDSRRDIKNVPLKDNQPNGIKNLVSKSKVKGISLSWAPCYDDNGNPVTYKIYRVGGDGTPVHTTTDTKWLAPGSESDAYSYIVRPVDSNDNIGAEATSNALKLLQMYYSNADGSEYGLEYLSGASTADAYSVIKTYNGVKAWTLDCDPGDLEKSKTRYIYFKTNADCQITENDAELIFEVEYLDKGPGPIDLVYNRIKDSATDADNTSNSRQSKTIVSEQNGSEVWRTVEKILVTNAALRNSDQSSKASFGIKIPVGTPAEAIVIKEIRVIKAEDYE